MNKNYKGIILAGGLGTRLHPVTRSISKQLLPIYDKPMIFYPLSTLLLAGIKEILIITTKDSLNLFESLLGNGKRLGIDIQYKVQDRPGGIAEAFIYGEEFIGDDNVCLILGDNIFYGHGLTDLLLKAKDSSKDAVLFSYLVSNPEDFGIVDFKDDKPFSIKEKPKNSKSNHAITGLYFYKNNILEYVKKISPSSRGELEISDINQLYLSNESLEIIQMGRGMAWLDTGTFDSLMSASQFVATIQNRQGTQIACLEEIAFLNKWISKSDIKEVIKNSKNNILNSYLEKLI